jgi:cyanate lyase
MGGSMNGNDIRQWILSEMTNHGVTEEELAALSGLGDARIRAYLGGEAPCISEEALKLLSALDLELIIRPRDTPVERP